MRALALLLGIAACGPLPPDTITPTEARGLAMLRDLRAMDPCEADALCREVRCGNTR
ncbi:hypothetical protein [Paracoccus sp. SJTW-4]|uniref:hypothetical protein n=1 Tax=Paracoccus sp. SJTW-4 TaxID=3078428 RepID=UPI0039E8D26F